MKIKIFFFFLIGFKFLFAQPKSDLQYRSYLAHIAAANSSLRLNEKSEANKWIENAPKDFRGWEWNYLKNRIDQSSAKFDLKEITPTKISYSKNGKYFVFGDLHGNIHIYNSETLEK
ncbi:MAG: hypothetical protein WAR79_20655 [Melioribacteraceae bacterium]